MMMSPVQLACAIFAAAVASISAPGRGDTEVENRARLQALLRSEWQEVFFDPCTGDWQQRWMLDGAKATISTSERGMDFRAGPTRMDDASHAVLWTREVFSGDIRIDYEYTRLDESTEAVTILYIQASGSGAPGFDTDIAAWAEKRVVPAMRQYFDHMNVLHISYAAFPIGNTDSENDYIRARRYLPERSNGLKGTGLTPDFARTGLFRPGEPCRITVIKTASDLLFLVRTHGHPDDYLCRWKLDSTPPIEGGRIGLRHMWTRAARYRDFRVSVPASALSDPSG